MIIGQIHITETSSPVAGVLQVTFTSAHTEKRHQLYIGRRLVAETDAAAVRVFTVPYEIPRWGEPLTVAAITAEESGQDWGADLPQRAYNRLRLTGTTSEAQLLEVVRGEEPEGAIDEETVVSRKLVEAPGAFSIESDPLPGSGEWNVGVRALDEVGNRGDLATASASVNAIPPDLEEQFTITQQPDKKFTLTVRIPNN